jgi:mRNA-degrading endonuclease RelE of RelBE toxin-antitoxin system
MSGAPRPLELVLTRHAERDLLAIPEDVRQRVKADLRRLAQGRLPPTQVKKLHGFSPAIWQLTSGRYRVFYRRLGEELLLLRAVHKPEQLRALRSLR